MQGVELRVTIKDIADDLGVCGTVENKGDGSVHVVCEAEQSVINEMIRRIKSEPAPVGVEKITLGEPSAATGMSAFEIIAGDGTTEMFRAISAGVYELRSVGKILLNIDNTLQNIQDTQDEIKDTQDEIKDTQDEINITLKSVDRKMDLSLDFMHNPNTML